MASTTCKVFRPTEEEFQSFYEYIKNIELMYPDIGLCKVIPPSSWKVPTLDVDNLDLLVKTPVRQEVSGKCGAYFVELKEMRNMTLQKFKKMADSRQLQVKSKNDFAEVERQFWRSLGGTSGFGDPVYGADFMNTLFRPTPDQPLSHPSWNLNELENLLNIIQKKIPGVNTPMMYVGTWRAMFAFHCEDMDLYSINYLHQGAPKSWYSILPKHRKRFETLASSFFMEESRKCREFLRHKTVLFSPSKLKENAIPFDTAVQFPGEFMITFPGSYHAGYNHGFNIAEATNFATEKWMEIGRQAEVCRCRPECVFINVDCLETFLLRKRIQCRRTGESLRSLMARNPNALDSCRSTQVSDYSSFFQEDTVLCDQYFDSSQDRVRCYCNITAVPPNFITRAEYNRLKAEGQDEEEDDEDVFTRCSGCELWFHESCVRQVREGSDLSHLQEGKCHICHELETSDVFDEKKRRKKRKYQKQSAEEKEKSKARRLSALPAASSSQPTTSHPQQPPPRSTASSRIFIDTTSSSIEVISSDDDDEDDDDGDESSRIDEDSAEEIELKVIPTRSHSPDVDPVEDEDDQDEEEEESEVIEEEQEVDEEDDSLVRRPQTKKNKQPAICRRDFVECLLPGRLEPVTGQVVSIEGVLGRLHVKGTARSQDVWVRLTDCRRIDPPRVTPKKEEERGSSEEDEDEEEEERDPVALASPLPSPVDYFDSSRCSTPFPQRGRSLSVIDLTEESESAAPEGRQSKLLSGEVIDLLDEEEEVELTRSRGLGGQQGSPYFFDDDVRFWRGEEGVADYFDEDDR